MENINEIKKRLHHIKGQLDGVEKMMGNKRNPNDILTQFKAIEGALQKAIYDVLDENLRKELAERIARMVDTCPGNCQDAPAIQQLKNDFPKLPFCALGRLK